MPTIPVLPFAVFAVVFLVLYRMMRPKPSGTDRERRHTPLSFAVSLVGTLFLVVMDARHPIGDGLDCWLGYACDVVLVGCLIRMYARVHQRGSQDTNGAA